MVVFHQFGVIYHDPHTKAFSSFGMVLTTIDLFIVYAVLFNFRTDEGTNLLARFV
jgi:hypothetical protein